MPFSECADITEPRPIRQGDVIRRISPTPDPSDYIGIIVTADCDIARQKHRGRLTYVPVLPLDTYLSAAYIPRRAAKLRESLIETLTQTMRQAQADNHRGFTRPISPERATRWVLDVGIDRVASSLKLSGSALEAYRALARAFKSLHDSTNSDLTTQATAISLAEVALGRGNPDSARRRLRKEISSHIRDLPGDALFLRSVTPLLTDGYVAYLRALYEVRDDQIATKVTQISFEVTHERISRLTTPYVYAMTQRLGAVFSAIGLPQEYEDARDACAMDILPKDHDGVGQ